MPMNRKQRRAATGPKSGSRGAGAGTAAPAPAGPAKAGRTLAALFAEVVGLHQGGRLAEAEALYRRILECQPELAAAWYNLADLLLAGGRAAEAAAAYRRALAAEPAFSAARNGLGLALQAGGDRAGALAAFRGAIASDPGNAEAFCNLGRLLAEDGQPEEAVAAYEAALAIRPELVEARYNLGRALADLGAFPAAEAQYRQALARRPDHAQARFGLALALQRQGDAAAAEAALREALRHHPDDSDAELALAHLLLERGDYVNGWRHYEARLRLRRERGPERALPLPLWKGGPVVGRRLLVWREQGIGDELLFAAWYPDVLAAVAAAPGGSCIIEADPRLVALFRRSFPAAAVVPEDRSADATRGDADAHVPAGSLPRRFGQGAGRFRRGEGCGQGWLRPDPAQRRAWAEHLRALGAGPKVGICWRSGLLTPDRRLHCSELDQWQAVLRVPGVTFVTLQYGEAEAELARAESLAGMRIHRCPGLDLTEDLDGTAALTGALDLVVSAPTAVATLASAVGIETWQLRHGARAPGQPPGDAVGPLPGQLVWARHWQEPWDEVLGRVAAALRQRV